MNNDSFELSGTDDRGRGACPVNAPSPTAHNKKAPVKEIKVIDTEKSVTLGMDRGTAEQVAMSISEHLKFDQKAEKIFIYLAKCT